MFKYLITLNLYTYDWSVEPHKRIDVKQKFECDSWDAAKDLIGLMVNSTRDSLSLEIEKKEVEA